MNARKFAGRRRLSRKDGWILMFVAVLVVLSVGQTASAYTITAFAPSAFDPNEAVMNATLGITDLQIEDFEDTTLLSGLSVSHDASSFSLSFPATGWDGSRVLAADDFSFLSFNYGLGATSFGIGISDDDVAGHTFQINGVGPQIDYTTFPEWVGSSPSNRSIYLRIDAELGDNPITSVVFGQAVSETQLFDHIAIEAAVAVVPEPSTLLLLGTGLVGLAAYRRKRRA